MKHLFTFTLLLFFISLQGQVPGTLDETFGDYDGASYFGQIGMLHFGGYHVVQNDDKIVLVGISDNLAAVGRFNADGTLDTTFGTDGEVYLDFTFPYAEATAVGVQSNGKIIVAGNVSLNPFSASRIALTRLNPDGSVDTSFGNNGLILETVFDIHDKVSGLYILSDDKILIVGRTLGSDEGSIVLIKYKEDGAIDVNFGDEGYVVTNTNGFELGKAMDIMADGKIVVVGETREDSDSPRNVILVRYEEDGTLDASFGNNGIVVTSVNSSSNIDEYPRGLAIASDDKVMVGGFFSDGVGERAPFAIKYNSNGSLDSSFGINGILVSNIPDVRDSVYDILIQPDGKFILFGDRNVTFERKFILMRYDESGNPDPTFGVDGIAIVDMYDGWGRSISYQSSGKLILGGHTLFPDNSSSITVLRVYSGFDLGILDFDDNNNAFTIVPNPIGDTANLNYLLNDNETLQISLYDLSGKRIKNFGTNLLRDIGENTEQLDFSNIPKGNYILQISNREGSKIGIKVQKE